jgi:hypothetical protein
MNGEVLQAAKRFLRDAYETEHKRAPTDEELVDWALLQWSKVRQLTLKGQTPGATLGHLVDSTEFPGLAKRRDA